MARQAIPYSQYKPKGVKDKIWAILVDSWENGLSDREAAFRASKVAPTTEAQIKKWVQDNPKMGELRDMLQMELVSQAKLNIQKEINEGNVAVSKWYLERKAADEFSSKAAVAFEGAAIGLTIEEKKKELDNFFKDFGNEQRA